MVTLLFTDIEGSTQRWERQPVSMAAALQRHDELLRNVMQRQGGNVFKTVGDAFCVAFDRASDAIVAAVDAQRALACEDWSSIEGLRVRMALHSGIAEQRDGDYFGATVNRVARLLAISHGGQVLISGATAELFDEDRPADVDLRDLGLHGLRDLSRAEHVFQLLAPDLNDTFPALRSLQALPNNLPVQLTSFVGRDENIAEIKAMLARGPLVTLAGPGGVGKTRCAVQAAALLLDTLPGGVWFIDFAPLSDAALVAGTIARTLGVREAPNRPLIETLAEFLAREKLLLILDNCEHVLEDVRNVTIAILQKCPDIRIVATSRETLNVAGEQTLRLPPLPTDDAIALFEDRALAASSQFALMNENRESVIAIVSRLDGIPLAIELAAARVKVLSPAQIAQHLDERFRMLTGGDRSALPRQQTLRATIDWSYNLLDESERVLFRRLAIFAGGWTLQAATEICGAGEIDEWSMLDVSTALVDKSLVAVDPFFEEPRYRMLQSMHDYAFERLQDAEDVTIIAERHAHFYAQWIASLTPIVDALEDERWKRLCVAELDNIRAAIDFSLVKRHDPAIGIALLAALEWPEFITSPQEALHWYERAAQEASAMPDAASHARILRHHVDLEWLTGRPLAQRQQDALRAVEVARSARDADAVARALAILGACYRWGGRFDEAEAAFVEAFEHRDRLSRLTANAVLRTWAVTDLQRGKIDRARQRFTEVAGSERPGSEAHANALLNVGELEYAAGNVDVARAAARRAREIYTSLGSIYLVSVLSNLAAYAMSVGDLEDARELLQATLEIRHGSGRWVANVVEHHALFAALQGNFEPAGTLLGYADARYSARGEVRQHTEYHGREHLIQLLSARYEAGKLDVLLRIGAQLTEEQAFELASAIHGNG